MNLVVDPRGFLQAGGRRYRCALGRAGVRNTKMEGDGATPSGEFLLRRALYRADRLSSKLQTSLPTRQIDRADGWCDEPNHADYNRLVRLPHAGSCEWLWRDDGLYDIVVIVGHNDDPVVAGAGSAIFMHVAAPNYEATEGCVALDKGELVTILAGCGLGSRLIIPLS